MLVGVSLRLAISSCSLLAPLFLDLKDQISCQSPNLWYRQMDRECSGCSTSGASVAEPQQLKL
jgi:hypothetical protein